MAGREVKFNEVSEWLGSEARGGGAVLRRVSAIEGAGADAIVFAADGAMLERALGSEAGLILAPFGSAGDLRIVAISDPRLAFSRVYRRWFDERGDGGVHSSAVIGEGVKMGAGCVIGARVVVCAGTTLGSRVRVQAGAVLGSDGFGFARGEGEYVGFPQIGTLWIGDDVEIGANTTIDRGALGETRIGRGTKIDNLVHIGHNCVIGEDVVIAAQTGIAGSTVVEDGVVMGGQVGIGEHAFIGKGVILGGGAGVLTGKKVRGEGQVFWGRPARPLKEYLRDLARLKHR